MWIRLYHILELHGLVELEENITRVLSDIHINSAIQYYIQYLYILYFNTYIDWHFDIIFINIMMT